MEAMAPGLLQHMSQAIPLLPQIILSLHYSLMALRLRSCCPVALSSPKPHPSVCVSLNCSHHWSP